MIDVVSAVILRGPRILLTQRRPDQDFPLAWETPGGKVDGEAGYRESHHTALRREIMEELGITCLSIGGRAIWQGVFRNDVTKRLNRREFTLFMYLVEIASTVVPRGMEGQGLGLFAHDEMTGLRLAPGNQRALPTLLEVLRKAA